MNLMNCKNCGGFLFKHYRRGHLGLEYTKMSCPKCGNTISGNYVLIDDYGNKY